MEEYFLLLKDKDGKTAFYKDSTKLLTTFVASFDSITKPRTSLDYAKNLKDSIDDALFAINNYFFVLEAIIVDKYENEIITIPRSKASEFTMFYKAYNN